MSVAVRLEKTKPFANEKGRLYFYDNAKFILIFLVVLAHYLSPLTSTIPFCKVVWSSINVFHMPAFIFISGFFAKSYIAKDNTVKVQRTFTYIVLYLAAQLAVSLFERLVLKAQFSASVMNARSSLWFLQCLILWHLFLPFVARFKASVAIPVSFVVALWAGYETQCLNFMAISRVLVHFPFFLCGYYCSQQQIEKLFRWKVRIPLLIAAAGIITMFALVPETGAGKIFTCNFPYTSIESISFMPYGLYWTARLAFYAEAFIMGAAFLSIMPRSKVVFTALGAKSLSVYILHRFVYLAELEYNWHAYFATGWGIAAIFGIALAMTVLFSLKPFTIPFDALQKIKVNRLLRN